MAPKHFAPVWQHYERHEPTGRSKHHRAICKFCKYELSGQPERMKTHLQRCGSCPADIKEEFMAEEAGSANANGSSGGGGYAPNAGDACEDESPSPSPAGKRRRRSADVGAGAGAGAGAEAAAGPAGPPFAPAPFAAVYESVRGYYSRVTPVSRALMSVGAAAPAAAAVREALALVPRAVRERFYGCGEPLPAGIEGLRVLDLGCGAGRDCYVAARLVGVAGEVIGVDMTDEQLRVARESVGEYARALGYQPHLRFAKGYIEFLGQVPGLYAGSIDLCISNSAVNLSPNKELVLRGVFDVLREGGEFQFSDIYADRRLPPHVRSHPALVGESVGGALYTEDFRRLCQRVGFADVRMASAPAAVRIDAPDLRDLVGATRFLSITFRLFKFARPQAALEPTREDYGHVAVYRGTIAGQHARVRFDTQWAFEAQRPVLVDGNTALMLGESWLRRHFDVRGDRSVHFGAFAPAPAPAPREPWDADADADPDASADAAPRRRPHVPLPTPYFISGLRRAQSPAPAPAPSAPASPAPEPAAHPSAHHRPALRDHPATFPRLSSFSISQSNVRSDLPSAASRPPPPPPPPLHSSEAFSFAASGSRFVMPASRVGSSYKGNAPQSASAALPRFVPLPPPPPPPPQQQQSPHASPPANQHPTPPLPFAMVAPPPLGPASAPAAGRSPLSSALMSVSPRQHSPASVATTAATSVS
ncbi:hypothetical protein IWW37_005008 [Coemansia sp. RSA 2050]|nr:hypothetical protein IWW37_005008 [Coemansia sp. RSA 2050]